jgi:hypothetical protein
MSLKELTMRVFVIYVILGLLALIAMSFHQILVTRAVSKSVNLERKSNLEMKTSLIAERNAARRALLLQSGEVDIQKEKQLQKRLACAILDLQPNVGPDLAMRMSKFIITESRENKLDPTLVTALIWTESRFNPMAHSKAGAVGLMQVRYSTWKETPTLKDNGVSAKHKLFWPELNIKCGTEILAKYYKEANHNIATALYRYNTGSTQIPKGTSASDISYVNKIMLTAYNISESVRNCKTELIEELGQINKS